MDADKILYTTPGRHEVPKELDSRLTQKIHAAAEQVDRIIVVYGGKFCYVNMDDPYKTIDTIIQQESAGKKISRTHASHCIDMLAGEQERARIGGGQKVWWLTPGWIIYHNYVFQDWDKGKANENFPQHTGGAILLDGIGFWERYSEEHPERLLELSDWMGIAIQPRAITLERFKGLLLDCVT